MRSTKIRFNMNMWGISWINNPAPVGICKYERPRIRSIREIICFVCGVPFCCARMIQSLQRGAVLRHAHNIRKNNIPRISQMRNRHWIAKKTLVQPMIASCMWQQDTRSIHINTWGAHNNFGSWFATTYFRSESRMTELGKEPHD